MYMYRDSRRRINAIPHIASKIRRKVKGINTIKMYNNTIK